MQKIININARRWFDKVNGNTYFSGICSLNGEDVANITFEYGYGDHCIDRLLEEACKAGHIPTKSIPVLRDDLGYKIKTYISDVSRQRDLK